MLINLGVMLCLKLLKYWKVLFYILNLSKVDNRVIFVLLCVCCLYLLNYMNYRFD